MDLPAADLKTMFDRLQPENLFGKDWVVVHQEAKLTMARKAIDSEACMLRAVYEGNLSWADTKELLHPEVFFDPRRPSWDRSVHSCGVEHVFAPGDAMCWQRNILSTKSSSLCVARAALVGFAQPTKRIPGATDENHVGELRRRRWMVRDCFPSPEHFACLSAPVCPRTGNLLEESFVPTLYAVVGYIHRHPEDQNRCTVTEVRVLSRMPEGSIDAMAAYYMKRDELMGQYTASSVYVQTRICCALYAVVGISRLSKGPPLLPKACLVGDRGGQDPVGDMNLVCEWEPAHHANTCAKYLQEFLHRVGVDIDVYDQLNGRRLIYYQAALRHDDWMRAQAVLDGGAWEAHCAAYRRILGARRSPKFTRCEEPRCQDHVVDSESPFQPATEKRRSDKADFMPVAATFIHFKSPPGLQLPRSTSNPDLHTMA